MDISNGHMTAKKSSAAPFPDNGGLLGGCSHPDKRTTLNGNCRLLPSFDIMDERGRNSLNWEEFFGSSLELAPSLLNLYDNRIATGAGDNDNNSDQGNDQTTAAGNRSMEIPTSGTTKVTSPNGLLQLPPQKVVLDKPLSLMDTENTSSTIGISSVDDNKKRPLSISSASSTSLTSSPRLRKKRANTFNGLGVGIVQENCQDSQSTIISKCDSDTDVLHELEPRNGDEIGSVEEYKCTERLFDSMSVTSSENGSFKDEVDNSKRDISTLLQNHSEKLSISNSSNTTSNIASPLLETQVTQKKHIPKSTQNIDCPLSSTPKKQIKSIILSSHKQNSEAMLPEHNLSQIECDVLNSPNTPERLASSSSRHDARSRFFFNYEEHMQSEPQLKAPIADEDFDILPNQQSRSSNECSSFSNSSSDTISQKAAAKSTHKNGNDSKHNGKMAPTPKSEHRKDRSSQLSPNSDKAIRRTDRGGSGAKHDRQPTSPRSGGLARTSKRREPTLLPETGSRSSPVFASYVSKVVMEIIESERTYIASLENIIHGYLEPMENMLNSSDAKKDITCLFSNIRDIYKFGCTFLSDLETAGSDPVKVAQCFVKYNKGFVIYTDYCTNYPRSVEVLTRFMQHPELSQLCKERQLALGHGLPLGAYLLKPVQRILKYHLLLHNIVKNCEKEKEDASILEQAFLHMTQMAHHINEMKRKHEHAVRIQEIQSQLEDYVGEDLTRLGELVLEGSFKVSGAKASRQVFLFEKGILISKMKEGGMLSCKTFIQCSNLMLVEVIPNEPLSFHIIPFDNPRAQDTLQARNMEQKLRWCHDIKKQILESFKGIPDNAKKLIMQLGRDYDDDYLSKEVIDAGRRNQHTAPEYLEKRRFRRKSSSHLPDFKLLKPQKTKKGTNKKNEIKSGEKVSKEVNKRSESKSPDRHHQLQSKQNFNTKRRSHSTSSSAVSLTSLRSIHDQSSADLILNNDISWPITKTLVHLSSKQTCQSPESPIYRKSTNQFSYSKEDAEAEAEITNRPTSFLMARANPILLEDITHLLARYDDSRKLQSPLTLEGDKENQCSTLTNSPDMEAIRNQEKLEMLLSMKPNLSENQHEHYERSLKCNGSFNVDNTPFINSCKTEVLHFKNFDQNQNESRKSDPKSISLPDLNKTADFKKMLHEFENTIVETESLSNKTNSQNEKDINENGNISKKSRSHMSRKDVQCASENLKQKDKFGYIGNVTEWQKENETSNTDSKNKKSFNENVLLRKTGLRLPNTSQLLATKGCEHNHFTNDTRSKIVSSDIEGSKFSIESLTNLGESSWTINSTNASSRSSMDTESLNYLRQIGSPVARPRGHSHITEMIQISNAKETDSLHRNSLYNSQHSYLIGKDNLPTGLQLSSQVPYVTPPRDYMTFSNMKIYGSMKSSEKPCLSYQDIKNNTFMKPAIGVIKPLGISPVTVTVAKPVSFNSSNLLRSNSTPNTIDKYGFVCSNNSKGRPVSMDVDKLTEESDRLLAEMEEYICCSYENMKSTNKFPTSLPAIAVEDEACSNRLSIVSSISTSSYESQDSNSSDGLIRTLKNKLRAWARERNDSEFGYASSFSSDEDDQDDIINSDFSSSAQDNQTNDNSSCGERAEPEFVVVHSLECLEVESDATSHLKCQSGAGSQGVTSLKCQSKTGSNLTSPFKCQSETVSHGQIKCQSKIASNVAGHLKSQSEDQNISKNCADICHELNISGQFNLNHLDIEYKNCETSSLTKDHLTHAHYSNPCTDETAQTPVLIDNFDTKNYSFNLSKSSNVNTSDLTSLTNYVKLNSGTNLLNKSNSISAPIFTSFEKTFFTNLNSDLNENDSLKLLNSNYSFERKMSTFSDSEIIKDEDENHNLQEASVDNELPRKSIREFVQVFEKLQEAQSQKMLEVKRKEPSVMIKQRLETLRENALHGWRSSSNSSSRPASEERDLIRSQSSTPTNCLINKLPFSIDKNIQNDTTIRAICSKLLNSQDGLSKSVENLSKSWESVYLSKSRESLNSIADIPSNRISVPNYNSKPNCAGHEKDATRFHYKSCETNLLPSGNQFIHKTQGSMELSMSDRLSSKFNETADASSQISKSMCQLGGIDTDVDSLVVMKGWVRALISKFQDQ